MTTDADDSSPSRATDSPVAPVLDTPRLRMRPLTVDDLDAVHAFTGRADAMAHYIDLRDKSAGWSGERTADFLREVECDWREKGYSRWAVELKNRAGSPLIGYCGLSDTDYLPDVMPAVELDFRLHPDFWGLELGPEAAIATLHWAFDHLPLSSVLANSVDANVQSRRALAKVDFTVECAVPYTSPISGRSATFIVHRVTRQQWLGKERTFANLGKRWTSGMHVSRGNGSLPTLSGARLPSEVAPVAPAPARPGDVLAARMLEYEQVAQATLPRRTYTVLRLEGQNFSTLHDFLERPFDKGFTADMDGVAASLAAAIPGACLAYTFANEIDVVVVDFDAEGVRWCGGDVQGTASAAAGLASAEFNVRRGRPGALPMFFTARTWTLPGVDEVEQYFVWRQREAIRTSLLAAGREYLGAERTEDLTPDAIRGLLVAEADINWNDYPDGHKRGRVVYVDLGLPEPSDSLEPAEPDDAPRTLWRAAAAPQFTPFGWLRRVVPERPGLRASEIGV